MLKVVKLFLVVAAVVGGIAAFRQAAITDHRDGNKATASHVAEYAIRDSDYSGSQLPPK